MLDHIFTIYLTFIGKGYTEIEIVSVWEKSKLWSINLKLDSPSRASQWTVIRRICRQLAAHSQQTLAIVVLGFRFRFRYSARLLHPAGSIMVAPFSTAAIN